MPFLLSKSWFQSSPFSIKSSILKTVLKHAIAPFQTPFIIQWRGTKAEVDKASPHSSFSLSHWRGTMALGRKNGRMRRDSLQRGELWFDVRMHYGPEQRGRGTLKLKISHELRSERTSDRSGARERSKQCEASEWGNGASKWASGRAKGPLAIALVPITGPITYHRGKEFFANARNHHSVCSTS